MRDFVLLSHIILGLVLIILSILILIESKKKYSNIKVISIIVAVLSWLIIIPSGYLYIKFYPATKTLIKAGAWPWVHLIFMETKEHLGLLIPIIATTAAGLVFKNKIKESRRWWLLLIILTVLMGIMGRTITIGALK